MDGQEVPLNIYREGERLLIAAPLPGMEPDSVRIDVHGRQLTIAAELRRPGRDRTQRYLRREWSVGPYRRSIDLPLAVDAEGANAVYNNGVLVVILPVASDTRAGRGRRIRQTGGPRRSSSLFRPRSQK